jgi:hypothetical protein
MQRLAFAILVALSPLSPAAAIAQTPAAEAPARDPVAPLRQWLRETAAGGPTRFAVRWQPLGSPLGGTSTAVKEAAGTFAPDLLQVVGTQTWLQAGRHTLVREPDDSWRLDRAIPEALDPPLLLRALAAELTTVAERSNIERDGRVVEQITVCLTAAQAERLVNAGAVGELSAARSARGLVKSGRITEAQVPVPTVDACIEVDVATHRILRVHLRALSAKIDMAKILRTPPGGQPAGPAEAPTPTPSATSPAPLQCKDGLPVRDEAGKQVVRLELVLSDHGQAPAVELDENQRALLGR